MINIRPYRPEDLEAAVAVFRSNIPKYFTPDEEPGLRGFLAAGRGDDYYVIELNGEAVGVGGIALNPDDTVSLCWGMIRADHLGTGLGRQLTDFRIALAEEKFPGRPLVIGTSQHTSGFYEKYGFRILEHIPDAYGPGIDECRMRLDPAGDAAVMCGNG